MPHATPRTIGRYTVVRRLGEGGMGIVYLAQDTTIDRLVAVKLMRVGSEDQLHDRFAREARSLGRLNHPNVVTIFEVGEHESQPFMAMEYVAGETLASLIRGREPAPLADRLGWMDGVLAGVHCAHRAGIIHRDIKPTNVVIDGEGTAKVLDFGIARGPAINTHTLTQAGAVVGTISYMSPEQIGGKPVDHRTDVFSIGAVFYELLVGRQAFPGDIQSGVLHLILSSGPAEPLARARPDLDVGLIAIVNRCLERDRELRYPDLGETRRDLAAVRKRLGNARQPEAIIDLGDRQPMGQPTIKRPVLALGILSVGVGGLALAAVIAGASYYLTKPTPIVDERTLAVYQEGCEGGDAGGCAELGSIYETGRGVTRDEARAVLLYQRACDAAVIAACTSLGRMYMSGSGVGKDGVRAIALFRLACDRGHAPGCAKLDEALANARGVR
jgi:hypothetical protein